MDIIDVDDVLGDDSFIGDTEQLDDEVEEILKQWKSSSTFPSSAGGAGSSGSISSSNSAIGLLAVPAAAAAAASNSFGFGTNHHHQHLYGNSGNHNSSSSNNSFNSDSKGLKYIDTRTFTRPKKKLDSTFNSSNVSAELVPGTHEHTIKMSSPLLNLQIGGPVTLPQTPGGINSGSISSSQLMQKSWLNDVSPPGSIMSSMEFSVNEKLGSSLITSGDFTNVSYLLNGGGANGAGGGGEDMAALNSHSSYDGYRLADVIKDRKFLENLSCFDEENTMTKDCAISRTDLNGIEENLSGFSTMQSSLESVTKAGGSGDVTVVLENGKADATFELEPTEVVPPAAAAPIAVREKLNGTFERRRNFDTYRKPKSSLNSTFDALPKVDGGAPIPVANQTFDAADEAKLLDATFPADNCNGTFSLNRTAKVNGAEKQLNQTYEYCEKVSPAVSVADRTFEARRNGTFVEDSGSPANRTPNGTFELPTVDRSAMVQSTPFVQVPRAKRVSGISEYEVNCSPIAASSVGRRSEGLRRSRNLEQDMAASHMETDDFDVEFRKLPITPNSKTESGSHLLDNEKRISLQHFEEFEKSIMESENNDVDFDEMLNSLTDVRRTTTDSSVKLRQSLDNIKKRHSRINTEKQQEELKKRGAELNDSTSLASPLDNKLADSMIRSMSSSGGSERLLNRRSRYNDDVHLTLSPQQLQRSVTEAETNELNRTTESNANPLPTAPEVGGSDKKNRDRFKTIRISKRREEGMVIVPDPDDEDVAETVESASLPVEEETPGSPLVTGASAFGRVDYNSPKESRLSAAAAVASSLEQIKTEDAVFKRPQLGGVPKAESKMRSLSKPRNYYGASAAAGGFGLTRKDLTLPLSAKSSSTDNLENDRPNNYQQPPPPGRLSLGGKLGGSGGVGLSSGSGGLRAGAGSAVQSNLKSPMGTKSKSHHNLYFNQGSLGGSNSSLNRIPAPLGLSAQKLSHNNSNTELKNNTSKLQLQLRAPRASSLVRPVAATMQSPVPELTSPPHGHELLNNTSSITTTNSSLSGVQMRAPKANNSRLGLVRPSSGYFSYSSHRKNVDSDTESINSLSSSSASSRGSLYRVDSQTIANNVQTGAPSTNSVEDISLGLKANHLIEPNRTAVNHTAAALKSSVPAAKPSGLRPPSNLRPPTARSGLPRPTSYVRR